MITTDCLFVLAVVMQVISAEESPPQYERLPEKCRRPPLEMEDTHECCRVAPMYSDDELSSCGFEQIGFKGKPDLNSGPLFRSDCSKQTCLLDKKGFLDGGSIKYDAIASFLDQWTEVVNEGFKESVDAVKDTCMVDGGPAGPPQLCEASRVMYCVESIMFSDCPAENWQQTDICIKLKEHIEDCKRIAEMDYS